MLKLIDVKKIYRMGGQTFEALKGVSFEIADGELISIVGPSGSGKSTLMNIIGLLDRPTTGKYFLDEDDVTELSASKRARLRNLRIGFVFQSFFLLPRLNALQNVSLPLTYRGEHKRAIKKKSMDMLAKVGMDKHWHHKPTELSGGQQQRVAIARALVGHPSIVLADEPTGALDSVTSQEVMDLLKTLNRETNATVLIITHDPGVARQCHRTIHIRDGLIKSDSMHPE